MSIESNTGEAEQTRVTTEEARRRCSSYLNRTFREGEDTLIVALPSLGKSYGSIKEAGVTETRITALTGRGHKEQYSQFKEWCDEFGLSCYRLPSVTHDCPTGSGDHGEEWQQLVSDATSRGISATTLHEEGHSEAGSLPCGEHCRYTERWSFEPNQYDVLIGHYNHAHVKPAIRDRTVVIDEFPGETYEVTFDENLRPTVTAFLKAIPGLPFESYDGLIERRQNKRCRAESAEWFDTHGLTISEHRLLKDPCLHSKAPYAVYALLFGTELDNGWRRVGFEEQYGMHVEGTELTVSPTWTGAYNPGGSLSILDGPDLDSARSVVGLDGTPTPLMWEDTFGRYLEPKQILSDAERTAFLRQKYHIVLTTEHVNSYSGPSVKPNRDYAYLRALRRIEKEDPGLITTKKAEKQYKQRGHLDLVDGNLHYGDVLGSNTFKEKRLGTVIGTRHYSDEFIHKWAAYMGESAERSGKGTELTYGDFSDRFLRHMRDHQTFQALMRFGRETDEATVYVHTNSLPDWVPITEHRALSTPSDGLQGVVTALSKMGTASTGDLVDHPEVSIGKRQVRRILRQLADENLVKKTGKGRGTKWHDIALPQNGPNPHLEVVE